MRDIQRTAAAGLTSRHGTVSAPPWGRLRKDSRAPIRPAWPTATVRPRPVPSDGEPGRKRCRPEACGTASSDREAGAIVTDMAWEPSGSTGGGTVTQRVDGGGRRGSTAGVGHHDPVAGDADLHRVQCAERATDPSHARGALRPARHRLACVRRVRHAPIRRPQTSMPGGRREGVGGRAAWRPPCGRSTVGQPARCERQALGQAAGVVRFFRCRARRESTSNSEPASPAASGMSERHDLRP